VRGDVAEKTLPKDSENSQNNSRNHCDGFNKRPFPTGIFNPPPKEEYLKRACNEKCSKCPFFAWPIPGPPGRNGRDGRDGSAGQDGSTPYIGANGNWFINGVDLGTSAQGVPGPRGRQGSQGPQGIQGPQGDPGIEIRPTIVDDYLELSDEEKRDNTVLWIIYPDDFFEGTD